MAKLRRKKPALEDSPKPRGLSLDKLVAQITKDNRYQEIPTGPARGKELVEDVERDEALAKH